MSLHVRNNYIVPVKATIYLATVKADTSISAVTAYSNGIADQTVGPSTATDPLMYLTEIDQVKQLWNIKKLKTKFLQAGQECYVTHNTGPFMYEAANADEHALSYQRKYKAAQFVLRIEGAIAHDNGAPTEIAYNEAGVDVIAEKVYKFIYDAGVDLDDYSTSDNTDGAFTTLGVSSNKAVADNQPFDST